MTEKTIVNKILNYLKQQPQTFAWKTHGGYYGTAGIPDIIACISGRFFAFEVKRAGNKPTQLQIATLAAITAAGGGAYVVYDVDEVKAVIEKL